MIRAAMPGETGPEGPFHRRTFPGSEKRAMVEAARIWAVGRMRRRAGAGWSGCPDRMGSGWGRADDLAETWEKC